MAAGVEVLFRAEQSEPPLTRHGEPKAEWARFEADLRALDVTLWQRLSSPAAFPGDSIVRDVASWWRKFQRDVPLAFPRGCQRRSS